MSAITFGRSAIGSLAGLRFIESEGATKLPDAQPITEDMREMVDHFHRLGLVRRKPCAFQTPQGMIVHPDIMQRIRKHLSSEMDRLAERTFYGASLHG